MAPSPCIKQQVSSSPPAEAAAATTTTDSDACDQSEGQHNSGFAPDPLFLLLLLQRSAPRMRGHGILDANRFSEPRGNAVAQTRRPDGREEKRLVKA